MFFIILKTIINQDYRKNPKKNRNS